MTVGPPGIDGSGRKGPPRGAVRVFVRTRCALSGESVGVLSRIAGFVRDVLGGAAVVSS
jgi:hypothetical protein